MLKSRKNRFIRGVVAVPLSVGLAMGTAVAVAAVAKPGVALAQNNPCNPCGAAKGANPCNPCNPCAAQKGSNPCGAAKANPCNPCAAAKANPCNPCAAEKK